MRKKLFKINQLGSPFQFCICTDFKLNDRVENCDCKEIAKLRITWLTVEEWLKINTECFTYICSKFLCCAWQGYHANDSPYAISLTEHALCFSRPPNLPSSSIFCSRPNFAETAGENVFTRTYGNASHTTNWRKTLRRCYLAIGYDKNIIKS